MRIGIIALVLTVHVSFTASSFCQELEGSAPLLSALKFFDVLASMDLDSALRSLRTLPASPEERDRVRATLPSEGALRPTPAEAMKLDGLKPVLIYHERDSVFDIKVIDLPQAVVGLHARAILLISRPALKVLTLPELQALAAHELGHDFLWQVFERGRVGAARQQLELECDGIAVLTLLRLGLDPALVLNAVKKLEQFNRRFGVPLNPADYPTLHDREAFVTAFVRRLSLNTSVPRTVVSR